MDIGGKIESAMSVIVFLALVWNYFGFPAETLGIAIGWIVDLLVSAIFSFVIGTFVEAFTGDLLKFTLLNIAVYGFGFSVPAFAVAVWVMRFGLVS